jgi:uncharacterized membrane protein YbhN (UPF0104 family)
MTSTEKKKINKDLILKICKVVFLLAVALFLVRYFRKNITQIRELDFKINWGIFAIAMVFYFVYKFTLACLWHYITILDHANIKWGNAVVAYLYSILGKYIPGKVFMLAARFPAYDRENVPLRKVTVCFFIENICTLLGASFLFLISLFFFPNDILEDYKIVTVLLVIAFFICLNPKIINFFLGILEKITKKEDIRIPFTYLQMVKVVALFILNWLIVGTGFYILTCSMYSLPVSELLYAAGIYGLSAFIGIIAIIAPSGIGVREGIMVLGLSLIMPNQMAVIISIVSRLWVTVSELLVIFAAFVVDQVKKFRKKQAA